jgi:di/tricarboxylate transporter
MTAEMLIVLGILTGALVLFTTEWVRLDMVAWGVVISLILSGVLTTQEAFSGFSNSAVLTIASLFIVGGAILQTGLAASISRRILRVAGNDEGRLVFVIMAAVALLSSVMSSTGTVAVLLPAIILIARSSDIPASRLLIPLSFGSLLGGASTLIGTAPNLIVSELLVESGYQPLGFFSFTPVGTALILAGSLFMFFIGRHLLPANPQKARPRVETPRELMARYRLPASLYRLQVNPDSPLAEQSIQSSEFRQRTGVTILEINRKRQNSRLNLIRTLQEKFLSPCNSFSPSADFILQAGDSLLVQGKEEERDRIIEEWGLTPEPVASEDRDDPVSDEAGIAELILRPRSRLIGKTLVETQFASRYRVTVLDVHRPNIRDELDPQQAELRLGDTLLVQGLWRDIAAMQSERGEFIVVGEPGSVDAAVRTHRAPYALLILTVMLVLMITQAVPIAAAAMLAGLGMVLTGCLSMDEAYQSIDWKSILLIAGMLPMSIALEKTGLVEVAAEGFSAIVGGYGPLVVMAGLFFITSLFTQILSNTATTVLVAPVALAVAHSLSVQPQPMLMAVAIAASMGFATPVASPVNAIVMGAGDYRFADYLRVGVPMILLTLLVSMLVLPMVLPF